MIGNVVKYVNIHLAGAIRPNEATEANDQTIGWIEYAFVCHRQSDPDIPNTVIGTKTLGDIATKMYRGECIWTGVMPVSTAVPNVNNLTIKIPPAKCKLKIGDRFDFYMYYRDVRSTALGTDTCRIVVSSNMKIYS